MKRFLFIAFIICLCAFWASAQSRINIRISAEIKVENDSLTLGDIAQISGGDERSNRLKNVSLGYAPNVGMTRDLPKEKVALAISAAGFAPNEFSIDSPPVIHIHRAGQEISGSQLREAVEKAVSNQFTDNKIETRIIKLDLPEKIEVPVGKIDVRANFSNVQNFFAPFSLSIEIRVNDAVFRRLAANMQIEAYTEVLIATKDLAANSKIEETDVRLEKRRLEKPITNYFCDSGKLHGTKLIKNLPSGTELTNNFLISDVVVHLGDLVQIVGESGKMQISVTGEARTNGKIGDRIAVKNSQSNLVIQATVIDEGLVKVFF